MADWEDCLDNCKDAAAGWIQKRRLRDILVWLITGIIVFIILLFIFHHKFWKQSPQQEGKRYIRCKPSEDTYQKYIPEEKRVYEFDEFLTKDRKVKAVIDELDECAWRSVFDAIRFAQDLYDDVVNDKKLSEFRKTLKNDKDRDAKYDEEKKKYISKIRTTNRVYGIKVGYSVAGVLEKHFDYDCSSGFTLQSNLCLITFCFSMIRFHMRH